jgi:hypothetical protein
LLQEELAVPHVISISYTPADIERRPSDRYARVAVERARLVAERGIEGDAKGRGGARQLNVLLAEEVGVQSIDGRPCGAAAAHA